MAAARVTLANRCLWCLEEVAHLRVRLGSTRNGTSFELNMCCRCTQWLRRTRGVTRGCPSPQVGSVIVIECLGTGDPDPGLCPRPHAAKRR